MELRNGQVAVITGGASGIGLALARKFADRGLRLVLADIEADALDAAVAEFAATGIEVLGLRTDVSVADDVEALATAAYERFGAVHVLCNNAGVVSRGRVWEQSLQDWQWVIGVDLWSVIYGARAFIPRMLAGGQVGHIVNTASTAGLAAFPQIGPYNVSKSGVVALSETLWHELRGLDAPIGVSVLCPGMVATRIGDSGRNRPGASPRPAQAAPVSSRNPSAVAMSPADLADYVATAIEADQFWMITHPDYDRYVSARTAGILNRRDVVEPTPI
jgi:NAD(P)-dependent dehydrogenase (short-subunit alcohol dehydrogenase family)